MNNAHISLLHDLGLTEKESLVYLAVLELGNASVIDIAERAGIKRTSIYNFVDHLVGLGIIRQSLKDGHKRYQAVSPTSLLEIQQKRLTALESRMAELTALTNLEVTEKPRIQYFEGTEQMQQIEKESLECKEELAIWNRKRVIEQLGGPEYMEELDRQRRAKGVKIRLIAVKDEDQVFQGGESDETREIRYAPTGTTLPMAVSIYDTGKVGYITSQAEKFGILIESRELEQTMRVMFESLWEKCKA